MTRFVMKNFHGSEFSKYPSTEGGRISFLDVDKFDKYKLEDIVRSIGYLCDMVFKAEKMQGNGQTQV